MAEFILLQAAGQSAVRGGDVLRGPTSGTGPRTASDSASGTDVATRAVVLVRTASDSAGGTDVVRQIFPRTASDTASGTDVASRSLVLARSASDVASGGDPPTPYIWQAGGNGGPGCGGGGGGANLATFTSGAGGQGGDGWALLWWE